MGIRRGFYQFIFLYVAQKTAPARKIANNGGPLIDAKGHLIFEFFFVSAKKRIICEQVITSSSYCRTRHS